MMYKKAFTMLEMIFVVVISGVLAMGGFKAMQALYIRSTKANAITDMTLRSQIVLDQVGVMLYNRIPNSVIGSNPNCQSIKEVTQDHHVLEWLGTMNDELIARKYDGFIDIQSSDKATNTLIAPNIDKTLDDSNNDINLIFAGAFDDGVLSTKVCEGAFGFHNTQSELAYDIKIDDDNKIKLDDADGVKPKYIYEKYYLTDTAYAITMGEHVSDITNCPSVSSESDFHDFNNTLFLFYNYQPYKGETYCGDGGDGDVSILAEDISGFSAIYENDVIRLQLDMERKIKGSTPVHISKQKVVF